jgi:hypothetical protein
MSNSENPLVNSDLAFSAVERALSFNMDPESNSSPEGQAKPAPSGKSRRRGPVANDDDWRPSARRVQKQPNAWLFGALVAGAWVAVFATLAVIGIVSGEIAGLINITVVCALVVLPAAAVVALSALAQQTLVLRQTSRTLLDASSRLLEPESAGVKTVAVLGQAIRREMGTLSEGIDRAISRAAELQLVIRNELLSLDATYGQNEVRLRGLIQELTKQRDSIVATTEEIRQTVSERHTTLIVDLDAVAERISTTIIDAGDNLGRSLQVAGEAVHSSIAEQAANFVGDIDLRANSLLSTLSQHTDALNEMLEGRAGSIANAFADRVVEFSDAINGKLQFLTDSFGEKVDSVIEEEIQALEVAYKKNSEYLSSFVGSIKDERADLERVGLEFKQVLEESDRAHLEHLTVLSDAVKFDLRSASELLGATTESVTTAVTSHVVEINSAMDQNVERLKSVTGTSIEEMANSVSNQVADFESRIGMRILDVASSMSQHVQHLEQSVSEGTHSFEDILSRRSATLELAFSTMVPHFEAVFAQGTSTLDQAIASQSVALVSLLDKKTGDFAGEAGTIWAGLISQIDAKAEATNAALTRVTGSVEERLEAKMLDVQDQIQQTSASVAARSEAALDNILQSVTTVASESVSLVSLLDKKTNDFADEAGAIWAGLIGQIDAKAEATNAALTRVAGSVEERLEAKMLEVQTQVEQSSASVAALSEAAIDTILQSVTTVQRDWQGKIVDLQAEVDQSSAKVTERSETAVVAIVNAVTSVERELQFKVSELEAYVAESVSRLGDAAQVGADGFSSVVGNFEQRLGDQITADAQRFQQAASSSLNDVVATMDQAMNRNLDEAIRRVEVVNISLQGSTREAAEMIEVGVLEAQRAITQSVHDGIVNLPQAVAGTLEMTTVNLQKLSSVIASTLTETLDNVDTGVKYLEDEVRGRIISASTEVSANFAEQATSLETLSSAVVAQLTDLEGRFNTMLSVHAPSYAQTYATISEQAENTLVTAIDQFTTKLDRAKGDLEFTLSRSGNLLMEALRSQSNAAANLMDETNAQIIDGVSSVLEKVAESNSYVHSLLANTTTSLTTVQSTLADMVASHSASSKDSVESVNAVAQLVENTSTGLRTTLFQVKQEVGLILAEIEDKRRAIASSSGELQETNSFITGALTNQLSALDGLASGIKNRADEFEYTIRTFATSLESVMSGVEDRTTNFASKLESDVSSMASAISQSISSHSESIRSAMTAENAVIASSLARTEQQVANSVTRISDGVGGALARVSEMASEITARGVEEAQKTSEAVRAMKGAVLLEIEPALKQAHDRFRTYAAELGGPAGKTAGEPSLASAVASRAAPQRAPKAEPEAPVPAVGDESSWLQKMLQGADDILSAPQFSDSFRDWVIQFPQYMSAEEVMKSWSAYNNGETGAFTESVYLPGGASLFNSARDLVASSKNDKKWAELYIKLFETKLRRVMSSEDAALTTRDLLISREGLIYVALCNITGKL